VDKLDIQKSEQEKATFNNAETSGENGGEKGENNGEDDD
jgi:hypothetical protein